MSSRMTELLRIGHAKSFNCHQHPKSCAISNATDQSCQNPPRGLENAFLTSHYRAQAKVCVVQPTTALRNPSHLKAMGGHIRCRRRTIRGSTVRTILTDRSALANALMEDFTSHPNLQGGMALRSTKWPTPRDRLGTSVCDSFHTCPATASRTKYQIQNPIRMVLPPL